MELLDTHLQRPSHIFYAGDFNARILSPELDQITTQIGPAVFPSLEDLNTIEGSNYGKLLEFIMSKDYCIVSTFFQRPNSHIITHKEILAGAEADPKCPDDSCFLPPSTMSSPLYFLNIRYVQPHRCLTGPPLVPLTLPSKVPAKI